MFNDVGTFAIFALFVRLELCEQGLKVSQPIALRMGIEHACVSSLVAKGLTSQGLKWRFQLNVVVHLFHSFCKECGRVIMVHIDEARQLACLCMINSEPRTAGTGKWEIFMWPTVEKMLMVMEIRLNFEEETML